MAAPRRWLSQHLGWRWLFLVNLPAGLAGMLLAGSGYAPSAAASIGQDLPNSVCQYGQEWQPPL